MLYALSIGLTLSFILNIYLFMKWKSKEYQPLLDHHEEILKAVMAYERDRHVLIDLQQINPDNIYLRSPGR